MSAKAERLHLRVDTDQKALLEAASRAVGASVSTFVLRVATEAAAQVFDEALARPAGDIAGLRELVNAPTVLDDARTGEQA